ncbi:predicted protein [Histoplasma capsulatum G186AR]|uniref:Uncharacterized protein n=1 Tax=Ajellomyces capsulatus (strain G186AR / H82 / ATCC MYA-2454 / RMSCC 2432) TaxID=447093 RepID=C0NPF1_AJECG|nr:uncharacterized protein HCBG_05031 [Histoplasma capsulatum G186AR]EEH06811.1 predicted protein [Histoplasma capsulatum G186AR]
MGNGNFLHRCDPMEADGAPSLTHQTETRARPIAPAGRTARQQKRRASWGEAKRARKGAGGRGGEEEGFREVEDVAVGACSLPAECLSGSLTTQLEGSDRRNVHGHGRAASRHA